MKLNQLLKPTRVRIIILFIGLLCIYWLFNNINTTFNNRPIGKDREMRDYQASDNIAQAEANWKQYQKFRELHPGFKQLPTPKIYSETIRDYQKKKAWASLMSKLKNYKTSQVLFNQSYHYTAEYNKSSSKGDAHKWLNIVLTEYLDSNIRSGGGSGFKTNIYGILGQGGYYIYTCVTDDNFNGTYVIRCRMFTMCVRLHVKLQYVDFNAYKGMASSLNRTILNETICLFDNVTLIKDNIKHQMIQHNYLSTPGWYLYANNKLEYVSKSNAQYPSSDISKPCAQLSKYDRMFLVGASHVNFFHQYLSRMCGNLGHNIRFELRYIFHFPNIMHSIISKDKIGNRTKDSLFFLTQSGIWNLCYPDVSYHYIFTHELNQYVKTIESLVEYGTSRDGYLRIIVLTTPPRNDNTRLLFSCNNFVVSIFNLLLEKKIRHMQRRLERGLNWRNTREKQQAKVEIEVVDMFELTAPVSTRTQDKIHFMTCTEDEPCVGEVGIALAQLLIHKMTELIPE